MLGGSDDTVGASSQAQLPPAADDVRAQLDILLASPDLDAPARARRFLRYVVEETLAGRADRIKGYAIGTEVFERSSDFDAQSDPVVRIEAGRLRRALERYYLSSGLSDADRDGHALAARSVDDRAGGTHRSWSYCVSLLYLPSFQTLMS
jgi:adenylate cyclase